MKRKALYLARTKNERPRAAAAAAATFVCVCETTAVGHSRVLMQVSRSNEEGLVEEGNKSLKGRARHQLLQWWRQEPSVENRFTT